MSVARKGGWMALGAVVCAFGLLAGAGSALAETKTFAKQGCEKWEVPTGVSSVAIQATGAAGEAAPELGSGGKGDGFSAVLSGLSPGEDLFVCVAAGGGSGVAGVETPPGGNGGGASGVSRGSTFDSPVLVAAGGGGGADSGANGGNAGEAGEEGTEAHAGGGGAGTLSEPGKGGAGENGSGESGESGAKFTSAGPGRGGAGGSGVMRTGGGGGGGGGYFGGGGGGAGEVPGGGGGGSDFCGNGATSCAPHAQAGTKHEAGEAEGDAKVTLTYTALPTSKEQCKKDGWKNFGSMFKNQGQCVKFVETGR
jgi:hypothetical protein